MTDTLSPERLRKMHAYFRAANYLSVGQIYLLDNPLLREPLRVKHINTPFDMVVRNDLDRFHLVQDVIDRVPGLDARAAHLRQAMSDKLVEHVQYTRQHGEDLPEVRNWRFSASAPASTGGR